MFTNPLTKEMEAWHKDHNGRHDDPAWAAFLDDLRSSLNIKYNEMLSAHDNNGLFGMSKAGGCTRSAALKRLGYEGEPFDGSTRVTFFLGHLCETIAICTLRACGYTVDGAQEPVSIPGLMHSFSDAILPVGLWRKDTSNTSVTNSPLVLSVKSAGYKKSGKERRGGSYIFVRRGFPELPFEGVQKSQPGWYAQVQAEMHGHQLAGLPTQGSMVVVMSKDIIKAMAEDPYLGEQGNGSLTFYTEHIPYDRAFVERELIPVWTATAEAVDMGKAGPAMYLSANKTEYVKLNPGSLDWKPNADRTGTFNPCSYCDLVKGCQTQLAKEFRR